jgi:2-amino-4-hydroxy-6-hydroxymethyldihydropteridine diphosphokinase
MVHLDMDNQEHKAYVSVGSNLGDREANIARAIEMIEATDGCTVTGRSPLITYPPEGGPPGCPDYLNGAIALTTTLDPFALRRQLQSIESRMGRPEPSLRGYNDNRAIDLDLVLYDQALIVTPDLVLPHPRMHKRRFVLEPLAAVAPDAFHPVLGRTAADLLKQLKAQAKGP